MVVALVSDDVTLKRFYPEGETVRLQPANPRMEPIRVPADRPAAAGHRGRADAAVLSCTGESVADAHGGPVVDGLRANQLTEAPGIGV